MLTQSGTEEFMQQHALPEVDQVLLLLEHGLHFSSLEKVVLKKKQEEF